MAHDLLITPESRRVKGARLKTAFPDRRTLNVLLTILLVAAVCGIVYSARSVIAIFVFAVLFAYLLNPFVKFLERHSLLFRNLRRPAVVEAYLAFVFIIVLVGHAFAPGIARNTVKLIDGIPVLLDGLSTGDIATELGDKYGWSDKQEARFRSFLTRHRQDIESLVGTVDRHIPHAAGVLFCIILVPILAIFFPARRRTDRGQPHSTGYTSGQPAKRTCYCTGAESHSEQLHESTGRALWFVVRVLFGCTAAFQVPARDCIGGFGRVDGVHTDGRMG